MNLGRSIEELQAQHPEPLTTLLLKLSLLAQTVKEIREEGERAGLTVEQAHELIRIATDEPLHRST